MKYLTWSIRCFKICQLFYLSVLKFASKSLSLKLLRILFFLPHTTWSLSNNLPLNPLSRPKAFKPCHSPLRPTHRCIFPAVLMGWNIFFSQILLWRLISGFLQQSRNIYCTKFQLENCLFLNPDFTWTPCKAGFLICVKTRGEISMEKQCLQHYDLTVNSEL